MGEPLDIADDDAHNDKCSLLVMAMYIVKFTVLRVPQIGLGEQEGLRGERVSWRVDGNKMGVNFPLRWHP